MATDSKGNELKVGDILATDPITIVVEKIENGCIYLAREGWKKRMLPSDTEQSMLVKLVVSWTITIAGCLGFSYSLLKLNHQ